MKALTPDECVAWLKRHGFALYRKTLPSRPRERFRIACTVPDDSGSREHLARWIEGNIVGQEVLLWMTDWPLFTAAEMADFDALRRRSSEGRMLIDAPGHLFGSETNIGEPSIADYVLLMFSFNWEGHLLCSGPRHHVWLADEIIEAGFADATSLKRFKELLPQIGAAIHAG